MKFRIWLQQEFYTSVVRAPRALAWFQNLYWAIEAYGEVPNLDHITGRLGDEWLERNLTKHMRDEERHARLWSDLLHARGDFNPAQLPPWANTVAAFHEAGWLGMLERLTNGDPVDSVELIPFFAALHILEVDGVERFSLFAQVARPIDPQTAEVLDSIIKDEQFHVWYTREAVLRLGKRLGCEPYALECIAQARSAYEKRLLASTGYFIHALQDQGAKFSTTFLTVSTVLDWIGSATGAKGTSITISPPPVAPSRLREAVAV